MTDSLIICEYDYYYWVLKVHTSDFVGNFSLPDRYEWVNSQLKVWTCFLEVYISKPFACHAFNHIHHTGKKMWNPYYEICNCTTKSIVYPYYFGTVSIVWKYTIIMNNQNPFYFQSRSMQFPFYDFPWIFKIFSVPGGEKIADRIASMNQA
jgi:hypothetical protein